MARTGGTLLMFAGTAALLVALVVLWQSTRSDTAAPTAPAQTVNGGPAEPGTTPGASSSPPGAARVARPPTTGGFTPSRTAPSIPVPAPASSESSSPPSANGEGIEFGAKQLHAQTKAVEPLVRECVEKAVTAGAHPTGTAMLTYHVAKRDGELTIENTGIDNEKTTLENEPLLECLHQTANAMTFAGLPRNAQEIYAARRVTLQDGKITEYKHVTFSYLR